MNNYDIEKDSSSPIAISEEANRPEKATKPEFYVFRSETGERAYQDFVEKNIGRVLGLDLFLIKECPAGRGGRVDFLGISDEGLIFLIEVKCQYDQRATFDVIFQSMKYYLDRQTIFEYLFDLGKPIDFPGSEEDVTFESLHADVKK